MPITDTEFLINIEWEGPYPLDKVHSLTNSTDYGVYQVYGRHPVYGNAALLYIGLAAGQHFRERIPQEIQWTDNRDAGRVEVYVGRFAGEVTPNDDTWGRQIRLAERLLIFAHSPPMNTQKSLAKLEPELQLVRVLNCARHRDLQPEVSGACWTSRYDEVPNYHVFSDENVPEV